MRTTPNERLGGSSVAVNGPVIRFLRQLRGYSMVDLSGAIEVHRSLLSKLESGATQRVSPRLFKRLLDVLGIDDPWVLMLAPARLPDEDDDEVIDLPVPARRQPVST
jgi:transcriptional regulator with XRE-family HTH domain